MSFEVEGFLGTSDNGICASKDRLLQAKPSDLASIHGVLICFVASIVLEKHSSPWLVNLVSLSSLLILLYHEQLESLIVLVALHIQQAHLKLRLNRYRNSAPDIVQVD